MRKVLWKRWKVAAAGLLLSAAALSIFAEAAQKKIPAGSIFVPDKGKLNVLLDGKSVGHEEFEIAPAGSGWTARGTTTLKPPGGNASSVTGTLTLEPHGAPISYEWSSQAEKTNGAHIQFENGVARISLQMQGARAAFNQDLTFGSPLIIVLDNNLYHQYALLARIYDWSRRGTQTFSVLIPQDLAPGTISVDQTGAVSADGKTYEGLKIVTSDLTVILYLDSSHRLMRLDVPDAKVAVVRE